MEKYITTNDGLHLWSESFGEKNKPAILLIMGAMNQGIHWPSDLCNGLADAGFYVIRYDHRDTGKSDGVNFAAKPYDLNQLADDAISVLKGYEIEQAYICGFSMGGYIAQLIAISWPERIKRLILISSTADQHPLIQAIKGNSNHKFILPSPDPTYLMGIAEASKKQPQTVKEIEENLIQIWKITYGGSRPFPQRDVVQALRLSAERNSNTISPFNHIAALASSPDRLKAVKEIDVPTLVIHGKYDPCLPLEHGKYLADHIPYAKIKVLDMGHFFQWSWTKEILSNMLQFIDE